MKLINIIGCGESAANWDGKGESIGVNDCWKYGNPTDYLVLVNGIRKFPPQRLATIINSLPKRVITHLAEWREVMRCPVDLITFGLWNNQLLPGRIFHAETSPFVAMSWAYREGYDEMILWGVDFKTHQTYSPGLPSYEGEMKQYESFIEALTIKGVTINWTK